MFCKITQSRVDTNNVERLSQWIKGKWGPLISVQPGFSKYHFVAKPDGQFAIIMFWKAEADVQAWTENPDHQVLVPEFKSLMICPVLMDVYMEKDSSSR